MSEILMGFSAFSTVFLLVFQQQNIIHRKYLWAAFTSIGITLSQVVVIQGVVNSDSIVGIMALAAGGVAGVLSSMFTHEKLVTWYAARQLRVREES